MDRFPSFVEYRGMYNVDPDEHRDRKYDPENFRSNYHQTVEHLPKLSWHELDDVRSAILECLKRYGRFPGLEGDDVRKLYRYCVGDELRDRTARVELPNWEILTMDFVGRLQEEALASRPLWRIMIVGETPETVVMIYPNVIRVGSLEAGGSVSSALADAVAKEKEFAEVREEPHRRQVEFLKLEINKHLPLPTKRFRVLATFDNWRGNHDQVSIWILHDGNHSMSVSIEDPESVATDDYFKVHADGRFGLSLDGENDSPYYLVQWMVPATDICRPLRIDNEVDDSQVHVSIDLEAIVKDVDLRQ